MKTLALRIFIALIAVMMAGVSPTRAASTDEQKLVDQARIAVELIREDPNMPSFPALMASAKAVIVIPELVKASFFIGGEAGSGMLLVRNEAGDWSYPAFYTMAAASIGFQIGAQVSKVMFLIMTDGGLEAVMSDNLTLGVDASVAAGPVGAGIEAGTTFNAEVDIYSFSLTKGLFGGLSFEGAVLVADDDANEAYYGEAIAPRGIVIHREVENVGADGLRAALAAE